MEQSNKRKPLIKTLLYAIFYGVFIFIMSSFMFNSCRMSDTDIADDVIFDETTLAVFEADKDNFEVHAYDIEKRFEAVGPNKLLQLKYFYYIPEAEQMQLTIKYNTSYAKYPGSDTLPFEIVLKDQNGNIASDYFFEGAEKQGFGYIRIAWNDVLFTDKSEYTLYVSPTKDEDFSFLMQKSGTAHKKIDLNKKNAPYIFNK